MSGLYFDLFVLLSLHTNSIFVGPVNEADIELYCRLSSRGSFLIMFTCVSPLLVNQA